MNTIDKILLEEKITREIINDLKEKGAVNGLGPEEYPISAILRKAIESTIQYVPKFDSNKLYKLVDDIDIISNIHDIGYSKGGNFLDKIKADFKFSRYLRRLLKWTNYKNIVAILSFYVLLRYGNKYFYNK